LQRIFDRLDPPPVRETPPPLKVYEPPRFVREEDAEAEISL
jgi:hypothetical protein